MSRIEQEHIEVEPFDREYRLEELLPGELLAKLSKPWTALLPDQWAICNEQGTVHFSHGPWPDASSELLAILLTQSRPDKRTIIDGPSDTRLVLFPVDYELETKGYLVITVARQNSGTLERLCHASVEMLQQVMRLKHQTMLTSGLHGAVVEESYAQLKKKTRLLARSEEKYRRLAANLEIEVEKKTKEISLAHARLMNQEKMAAIGQLSAGMAHEINNPLGFIISNLETLKGYATDLAHLLDRYRTITDSCMDHSGGGSQELLNHCREVETLETEIDGDFLLADIPTLVDESMSGAKRIQKIVSDLKIVARPGECDPEPINIHASIDAVLTILQNRINSQVDVQRVYGPVPLVHGYPQEVNQVWLNLTLNALEAMGDKGTLVLETRTEKRFAMVAISDTGKGIPEDVMPKIFEPFFTTKEIGSGTGLGLHLAYQVVTKHQGRINVDTTPGQGSRFTVYLPAIERE